MRSPFISLLALILCVTVGLSAAVKKYGKPLTLKDTTKISDIYAKPDQYNGKRVKVRGPVVDVCSERGCWIAIGSDQEFQSILFKVDDGVMVFPMDAKGLTAEVEGILTVTTLSEADQMAQADPMMSSGQMGQMSAAEHMAHMAAKEKEAGSKPVPEPKISIAIQGEGAEIS
jgi:hypothetical protein